MDQVCIDLAISRVAGVARAAKVISVASCVSTRSSVGTTVSIPHIVTPRVALVTIALVVCWCLVAVLMGSLSIGVLGTVFEGVGVVASSPADWTLVSKQDRAGDLAVS